MHKIYKPLFIAFVDPVKGFYNVNWERLFKIMKDIGIDNNDGKIIYKCISVKF